MKKYWLAAVAALALSGAANAACFTYGNLQRCDNPDFSQSYSENDGGGLSHQWGAPPGGYQRQQPQQFNRMDCALYGRCYR
jgi:hypothetical protein